MARSVETIAICLPKELVAKVKQAAKDDNRSVSNYIAMVLSRLLDE